MMETATMKDRVLFCPFGEFGYSYPIIYQEWLPVNLSNRLTHGFLKVLIMSLVPEGGGHPSNGKKLICHCEGAFFATEAISARIRAQIASDNDNSQRKPCHITQVISRLFSIHLTDNPDNYYKINQIYPNRPYRHLI